MESGWIYIIQTIIDHLLCLKHRLPMCKRIPSQFFLCNGKGLYQLILTNQISIYFRFVVEVFLWFFLILIVIFFPGFLLLIRVMAVTFCVTLSASLAARQGPTRMAAFQVCLQVWLATSLLADGLAVAGQVRADLLIFNSIIILL